MNYARAVALAFGTCGALLYAPSWAARVVQDGIVQDGVPPADAALGAALARYDGGNETRLLEWTSDGALLVALHEDEGDQLLRLDGDPSHARALGAPGGTVRSAAVQTFHSDWVASLAEAPGAAADGAALSIVALGDGTARRLVEGASLPGAPAWAHDDRRIAFSAALRDPQHRDLYALDTGASAGPRLLASGDASAWQVLAWTSADRSLLVRHALPARGDELLLVDVETGAARRVDAPGAGAARTNAPAAGADPVSIGEARLTPDDRGVYFIADRGDDPGGLQYVDLYGNGTQPLPPNAARDVGHFDISENARLLAYSWNEAGYDRVAIYDRESARQTTLASLPPGVVDALRFDRAANRLAIEVAPSVAPRDVYVYDLASAQAARWSSSRLGEPGAQLVAPMTVRLPTWDRPNGSARALSALYYRPRSGGIHPVLLMLDDRGLRAQLDPFVQYCVNELGVAVVQPELRGGEAGILDLGAVLAWLGVQPDLKRDRVVALGRGEGGTLALEGLGLYGDRIRAAASIDGMATAEQLALVRRPVLLVQGLADRALDAGSAEQVLWRLRTAKVESWFVAPRDRRPALASAAEQAAAWRVIAQFVASKTGG